MGIKVWIDGEFYPKEEAKISVYDHGLLYGDGIFEGIRVYNGRIFKLEEHIDRLYDSAKAIWLEIPMSKEEMIEKTAMVVRENGLKDAYIRLVVTRGKGDLGLDPRKCPKPTIIIIADHISLYPQEYYEKGIEVITVALRRNHFEMCNPRVKSLNYLNNILAKIEAINYGNYLEAILLNQNGYVTECTADNVFMYRKGKLYTPPIYFGILEGITRNTVIELAKKLGIEILEQPFTRYDLYTADEVFLTGSAAELMPIVKIDGRVIGNGKPGAITEKIRAEYKKLVESEGYPVYK